jgi:hypothetical protein
MNNNTQFSNNEHNHNGLLKAVLPIDELIKAGRQMRELSSIEEYARSIARAIRTDLYDPKNPDDKVREDAHEKDLKDLQEAEKAAAHAAADLKDAEHAHADLQRGLAEPKLPTKVMVGGVSALAISIGPTIHDQLFIQIQDSIVAWALAMAGGALIGAFIVWAVAGTFDQTGKRSTVNIAGLIGGFGIGLFTFLLRLATGDILTAFALTTLEVATLVILEAYATGLRESYRSFALAREADSKAAAFLAARRIESGRRDQQVKELRDRIEDHKHHLAVRTFCAQKFAEVEEAALNIARKAFHERQAEEYNRRLGIS